MFWMEKHEKNLNRTVQKVPYPERTLPLRLIFRIDVRGKGTLVGKICLNKRETRIFF